MSVKVISQNVMCWEEPEIGTYEKRYPLLKNVLTGYGADVIGLQEVKPNCKEFLDAALPDFEHILVYRDEKSMEATPIYWNPARLTALESGHFWLSETPEVSSRGWDGKCVRIACWVLFEEKESERRFAFVNTHLDHRGETARQEGIRLVCSFIKEKFGDMPLVLTGDFNARPESPTIASADSLLIDARRAAKESDEGITFHGFGKNEGCIIDYIYLSRDVACERFEIIRETDGESVQSDHYGIMATIEL